MRRKREGEDMNFIESAPSIRLDIITYREDGVWVGHCVQLDLVASSREDANAAYEAACKASVAHVSYALNHDNLEHLFVPQSPELLTRMLRAKALGVCRLRLENSTPRTSKRVPRMPKQRPLPFPDLEVQRLRAA